MITIKPSSTPPVLSLSMVSPGALRHDRDTPSCRNMNWTKVQGVLGSCFCCPASRLDGGFQCYLVRHF
jgi:hypothetical protein